MARLLLASLLVLVACGAGDRRESVINDRCPCTP